MNRLGTWLAVGLLITSHPIVGSEPAPAREKFVPSPDELRSAYQRLERPRPPAGAYKLEIRPTWFQNNSRFWYRNDLQNGTREFIVVDAERGTRAAAFDHAKLAASISKSTKTNLRADRLPFDRITLTDDGKLLRFTVTGTVWECDLTNYECKQTSTKPDRDIPLEPTDAPPAEPEWDEAPQAPQPQGRPRPKPDRSPKSPDGKWTAFVRDFNVFVRPADGAEVQLTTDGKSGNGYDLLQWSPDSQRLVAFRVEPGEDKEVYLVESSPSGGGRAKLRSRPYPLPGDRFGAFELNLFDVAAKKQTKPMVERIDFGFPRLRWHRDGRHFTYEKRDRGHQRFRIVEVDAHTGDPRTIFDEPSKTFVLSPGYGGIAPHYLDSSDEILYASERDGWRHLYLIDAKAGTIKNRLTQGDWVVRAIDYVDEKNRQVWFRGSGRVAGQDPYFVHYYRVNFDGTGLVALTEGDGSHSGSFSPDRRFLIDTYSRVDQAPIHELRRTSDGKLVCRFEQADISELRANGWEAPEVFTAKGRDGKTDIWGIICRPPKFNPGKSYPVIEHIYAGPQSAFVPKTFSSSRRFSFLTDLGFIVVQMDGMGTQHRSKAFHDVCWHNLKDAGFADRILWHKAAARKYPHYDLTRVGIYGHSAGGQNAAAALLFHPDFYRVAVASCGCHDNRMDKASWNEQWMGYPVGPHYAACSNIDNAHRLRGRLFLIVGELDTNVPPESTLRFADALIKAGKDFDLLVVPGAGHSIGGSYGERRRMDFFVRHLHYVEPPERNSGARQ
jgi:dipeptidyl aminopeptidase/acylaminoacyl peptidase